MRFLRRLFGLLAVWVSFSLLGCSEPRVPVSDLDQARKIAVQVLEAWKSGSTMDDMKKLSPPIIVSEDIWRGQAVLKSYKFGGDGSLVGPNVRFEIQLNYEDNRGKSVEKSFAYLVTTTPAITFFREER